MADEPQEPIAMTNAMDTPIEQQEEEEDEAPCKMGKFGTCKFNDLIGNNAGVLYEIYDGDQLRVASDQVMSLDVYDIQSAEDANNREINDLGDTSQKLSQADIEELKRDSLKGQVSSQDVIRSLVENSATFEKKTEFSKAKYIKKKQAKFTKAFVPILPTAKTLCDFFFQEDSPKIKDIRGDTLSMILNASNVHAGMRVLVADDIHGLLVASVMERLGGYGTVIALHENDVPSYDIPVYCNFSPKLASTLQTISWNRVNSVLISEAEEQELLKGTAASRRNKKRDALATNREKLTLLRNGDFDALLVASSFNPVSVVETLLPYISGSRPVVVYHSFKEALTETYNYFRESSEFVNVDLCESWLREYQLPCYQAGTRPIMTGSSTGGYFVAATRTYAAAPEEIVHGNKSSGGGGSSSNGRPAKKRRW
ncbi:hypothetical protein SmJEL517_g03778 [Synchytrium microbalum]|uniref:tRNA (adenine(58)-N(1))-methyltransferase non-catalytic subunit TRM6 n=1 Tax=Synchytrium microbalum TaxID=1806994 RepID=A0A507C5R6_9FUNG|nr:uncharacterized protein SmJEL517_g03778 [Synchytrium microbalum]TPX33316.1 hypothetical protein SmJEL517_g03778 [Synchytrium microbalum]